MDDLLLVTGKGAEQLLVEVQKEDSGSATVEYLRTRGVEFTTKPSWASRLIPKHSSISRHPPESSHQKTLHKRRAWDGWENNNIVGPDLRF